MQEKVNGKWVTVKEKHDEICAIKTPLTNGITEYGTTDIECRELPDGRLILTVESEELGVNYCPICGYKAKKRI